MNTSDLRVADDGTLVDDEGIVRGRLLYDESGKVRGTEYYYYPDDPPPTPAEAKPETMEEWRTLYAALLLEDDVVHDPMPRKDTPNFAEMDKHGLGETEKRAMGQIQIARGPGELRSIPVWFHNDAAVRQFLQINFPYLDHDEDQLRVAARWNFVLQRFRSADATASQIAEEWNNLPAAITEDERLLRLIFGENTTPSRTDRLSAEQVRSVVQKVLNLVAGWTQQGKRPRGKRGRPKNATKTRTV